MISQFHIFHEKYRAERSGQLAAVCDITPFSISLVYYDLRLSRRFARTVMIGESVRSDNAVSLLCRLFSLSMKEYGVPASAVAGLGLAAPLHLSCFLEESLSPGDLFLRPDTDIFVMPFVSAAVDGRFTASLMALPEGDCAAADLGGSLVIARISGGKPVCAAFPLNGAFAGSSLESGMPCERGAIDEVYREKDGAVCYSVVADGDSIGVSASAALRAVQLMVKSGTVDTDGIMTDRDLFYIGEDFYISQSDVRAVQSDKAVCAAAFELFGKETELPSAVFLSGEPLAGNGFRALLALGAVPERLRGAGYCRNSAEQGLIRCMENSSERERAAFIADTAEDISERLLCGFDELYRGKLAF